MERQEKTKSSDHRERGSISDDLGSERTQLESVIDSIESQSQSCKKILGGSLTAGKGTMDTAVSNGHAMLAGELESFALVFLEGVDEGFGIVSDFLD